MKTKSLLIIISIVTLLFFPNENFAQAPDLGTTANFALFTISGAVGNTAVSRIKGDIGTNSGAISNFGTSTVIGAIHTGDAVTAQCSIDLLAAYTQLNSTSSTSTHLPVLGNGESLYTGVYAIASAGSVVAELNLDAQGDTNAIFIFKIGGAFTTAASATVNLVNGASASKVFWVAEGEIAMAALTSMKGTLIAHSGAISLGAGGMLEGRMLSTAGAVAVDAVSAAIQLPFPDGNILQVPNLGTAANFVLFTITGAVGNTGISQLTGDIGSNDGAITGFGTSTVNGTIYNADAVTAQCSIDLLSAYDQLTFIVPTATHLPVLGNGETLYAGVYALAAAGSIISVLNLDAQGDPNAIFIFKIGGAFTTAASVTVNLVNGASACNVFWVAEGAIAMAASTSMKGTLISHNGAISMGAGGTLEGRMLSTTGAASVYGVSATIPIGCSVNTSWTGAAGTADWFTAGNWTRGIPDGIMGTWIPTTLLPGRVFPIINAAIAIVDTLTIQTAASLTINSILQIKGNIINSGTLNARNGTIEMSGSSTQAIAANTFQNNALNHLIINNTSAIGVTLEGALDIYGSLTYSGTGMKLITNDALTLKSTAFNTATIGVMTGNTIAGKVTVEYYIPDHKAWRLLSIPTNTTQTIKETWQEGATNTTANPVTGYGTQVTSDRPTWSADGFDLYSANGPSMKTYDPATGLWIGVTNTNSNSIKTTSGYMTFIRGDRTANTFNSVSTQTVLRTKGNLFTGDQPTIFAEAGQFIALGNPYPSVLDMRNITKTGLKDFFYIWDPNLGSASGYGAYQTFSYDGNNYIVTPGAGSYGAGGGISNYIQSGQAFLVQATLRGGSISFNEAAKIGNSSRASATTGSAKPQLRVNLYGVKADNSTYMADGLLINYDDDYSNSIDDMDAIKSTNSSENLSIKTGTGLLVIEKRHSVIGQDTIFLNLANTKIQQYRFEFTADQLMHPGSTVFLEDNYLNTATALDLNGSSIINFNIENIAASYATDRFRIVIFNPLAPLPVIFTSIKALRKKNIIDIDWEVEHEINIKQYETERAGNGSQFKTISVTGATRNTVSQNYLSFDTQPVEGYNCYRIKAIDLDGKTTYTSIVKVLFEKEKQDVFIYPNPVVDGMIRLQLNNMPAGDYTITLLNNKEQEILKKIIQHNEGSSTELITMDKHLAHGIYQLRLIKPDGHIISMKVVY